MAGKGDKLRKGANLKAYSDNYDRIFRKRKTFTAWAKHFGDILVDFSGFRDYNSDDQLTEQEYKQGLLLCTTPHSTT